MKIKIGKRFSDKIEKTSLKDTFSNCETKNEELKKNKNISPPSREEKPFPIANKYEDKKQGKHEINVKNKSNSHIRENEKKLSPSEQQLLHFTDQLESPYFEGYSTEGISFDSSFVNLDEELDLLSSELTELENPKYPWKNDSKEVATNCVWGEKVTIIKESSSSEN